MNLTMECSSSDMILDLRKPKGVKRPIDYVYSSPAPQQLSYCPLTPPYYVSQPMPVPAMHPPVHMHHTVLESSDDASDRSNASPPGLVTSTFLMTNSVINASRGSKPTRPFKAYPKDPLALSSNPGVILGQDSTEEYMQFRKRMLTQLDMISNKSNANMKRSISPQMPSSTEEMDDKTAAYWERRRKNNEAAKRSRDARRAKEDEIAIRATFLEQENIRLRYELASTRDEVNKLRCLAYNR